MTRIHIYVCVCMSIALGNISYIAITTRYSKGYAILNFKVPFLVRMKIRFRTVQCLRCGHEIRRYS